MCLIFPRSVCVLCLSPLFWWFIISVDVLPLAIIIHTLPFPYETIFDELGTNYGAHLIQLSWDFFWKLYVPLYLSYFLRNMMAPVSGFVHMGHQDQDGEKVGQMYFLIESLRLLRTEKSKNSYNFKSYNLILAVAVSKIRVSGLRRNLGCARYAQSWVFFQNFQNTAFLLLYYSASKKATAMRW